MTRTMRRMWARRVLRAGWLLAPLLTFPSKVCTYLFYCEGKFSWSNVAVVSFLGCILFGMVSCTTTEIKEAQVASPAEITAALKGNPCMIELMPRWVVNSKKPLRRGDLVKGAEMCAATWGDHALIQQQEQAMKAVK